MTDPRIGVVKEVGTDTVRSPHPNLIFRKPEIKAEISGEWIQSREGRKLRGFFGRDENGEWRGRYEDIGHSTMDDTNGFALIKVGGGEIGDLEAIEEWTAERAARFMAAAEQDAAASDDSHAYRQALCEYLERLLEAKRRARLNLEAGMELLGIRTPAMKRRAAALVAQENARLRRGEAFE